MKPLQFAVLILVLIQCFGLHAEDTPPQVSSTALGGNLYLLQGRGGNVVASIGDDGIVLIDTDYARYSSAYHEALKGISNSDGLARFVINTHWHGDHTEGNAYWGERNAVILAQDNVRNRMSTRQELKAFDRVVEPSPRAALPLVTFADAMALHANGETLEIQHLPTGHTDGDSVVFFTASNVVHMGDLYFKDRFPFVDLSSGGNALGYAQSVAAVLARIDENTTVVPGHGALATEADLSRYHRMLTSSIDLVRSKLAAGETVADIAEAGLGDEWAGWGDGFINTEAWVSFIAASL